MYEGSCLCGGIEFQFDSSIESIVHCHCSLCRKSSGTAFATNGFVDASQFEIVSGQENLTAYEYRPKKRRFFCKLCGSPIYSSDQADLERYRVRLGVVDSNIAERPISHNFVSSRACWEDLDAELPRCDGHEAGRTQKAD